FADSLPADPIIENGSRRVLNACYSLVTPRQASKPELLIHSIEVAELIGIDEEDCQTERFSLVFTGNEQLDGMMTYASCYGGHQFGNWAGQLGDGRAINLGEVINPESQHWAIQLKGAGPTPYSRHADGFAVLRSSVREFLCSEAMFHLGVPTTRALSLCLTGDTVPRDMFYNGNVKDEPGAVVCRVAPSFTRFGHFQILAAQRSTKADQETEDSDDLLKTFIDFTIRSDFPHLGEPSNEVYIKWFNEVCQLTKVMIIDWMRVGFVHGVMNTDNMSILGLTIDYGPYGWLEGYDENWTPNTTDAEGKRYSFGQQAPMAHWNLVQLAQAISFVFEDIEPLRDALNKFVVEYKADFHSMMLDKLGLSRLETSEAESAKAELSEETSETGENAASDEQLISNLLNNFHLIETDMTIFYRQLATLNIEELSSKELSSIPAQLRDAFYQTEALDDDIEHSICLWLNFYSKRALMEIKSEAGSAEFKVELEHRTQKMNQVNPKYVLRNYLAQQAIDRSEEGDHSMLHELLDVMRHPYDEQPDNAIYALKRPEWARHKAGCSMLSCSS
ncbi:MAG: hypothetical protein ACI9N9_001788, partial [Enterobacterales bacterium]